MAQHRVKCYYCGEYFDANKEECGKVNANRYAHKKCGDEHGWEKNSTPIRAEKDRAQVKCLYCNKLFYKDDVPYKQVGRRYAHLSCYEEYHDPDDDYIGKIYEIVKEVFGSAYNYWAIEGMRAKMLRDGITNKEIYQSLYYWYKVKGSSTAKANGNIGIVPYIVDDANDYFKEIEKYSEKAKQTTFTMGQKIIDISGAQEKTYLGKIRNKMYVDPNSLKDLE